jgi:hypothetical protein
VLLAAGVVRWSNAGSDESFSDAQLACAVGAAMLALLSLGYTLRARSRSAVAAGALSVAALAGWVVLLFLR